MKKNRKIFKLFLAVCLAAFVVVLDLLFFLMPDRDLSQVENRKLQRFPVITGNTLLNGRFESQFDTYVADQFPFRNGWIRLKTTLDLAMGKTESGGVYLGKDGFLIQNFTDPGEDREQERIETIRAFASRHRDKGLYMLVAPTAMTVYEDRLPAFTPSGAEGEYLDRLKQEMTAEGLTFIDVRDALKEGAKKEPMYYHTDHHWTTPGAYEAYRVLAGAAGLPGKETVYDKLQISDSFQGTLSATSGFRMSEKDDLYVYLPKTPLNSSVTYVQEGEKKRSCYHPEALEVRDHYTVFFGGNHALVRIETGAAREGVLLVIKDSYANCFVPFLMQDYGKILMVDPRYYADDLDFLMEAEGVTDVLFLYNASTFAGDENLKAVIAE